MAKHPSSPFTDEQLAARFTSFHPQPHSQTQYMERPQRAMTLGIVLLILNAVGVAGFSMEAWKPLFALLTPFNLLLTNILLGLFHRVWSRRFAFWALLTALAGWLVEVAGVQTGLIFGEYAYLDVLGFKPGGAPLLIGVNWLMLVYVAGVLCSRIKASWWLQAAAGASLMTLLDVIMEPVAIRLEFWTWFGQHPPLQNYIAWWLIAFVLLIGFYQLPQRPHNRFAVWVLASQILFFGGLWLLG